MSPTTRWMDPPIAQSWRNWSRPTGKTCLSRLEIASPHPFGANGRAGLFNAQLCAEAPTALMPQEGLGVLTHSRERERPPVSMPKEGRAF